MSRTIRLYTDAPLAQEAQVSLTPDQVHYLRHVLRKKAGDTINLFNHEGEWQSTLTSLDKKNGLCEVQALVKQAEILKSLGLAVSPLKKDAWDFVVEKAVELGVTDFYPVLTEFTSVKRVNTERMIATARDALQQCERLSAMTIHPLQKLESFLADFPTQNRLYFCAERQHAIPIQHVFSDDLNKEDSPACFLIGPEGGFSDRETDLLKSKPFVTPIHLGTRILKAETAVVSSLSVWQALCGDWSQER